MTANRVKWPFDWQETLPVGGHKGLREYDVTELGPGLWKLTRPGGKGEPAEVVRLVRRSRSGKWFCDCEAFKYAKPGAKDCLHVLAIRASVGERAPGEREEVVSEQQAENGAALGSLAAAKILVMRLVPYVQKTKAQGLPYTFAGEAAFIDKLHPAMVEAGLTVAPEAMKLLHHEAYKTTSGASMNRIIVQATYRLTHAPSGESEVIETLGEGADGGDKATNKAMTSAYKYALRQAFLIETGNDPDETPSEQMQRASRSRSAAPPQQVTQQAQRPAAAPANGHGAARGLARITREQWEQIQTLCHEKAFKQAELLVMLGVDKPGDITAPLFEYALQILRPLQPRPAPAGREPGDESEEPTY